MFNFIYFLIDEAAQLTRQHSLHVGSSSKACTAGPFPLPVVDEKGPPTGSKLGEETSPSSEALLKTVVEQRLEMLF
jgi:hypothetical protein